MKKMFSILGAFCLGAFITIGVMACCADGTNDAPPFTAGIDCDCIPTVLQYEYSDEGVVKATAKFEYDENGRITTIKFDSRSYVVDYNENSIVISNTRKYDDDVLDLGGGDVLTFELTKADLENPKATNVLIYIFSLS